MDPREGVSKLIYHVFKLLKTNATLHPDFAIYFLSVQKQGLFFCICLEFLELPGTFQARYYKAGHREITDLLMNDI